MSEVINVEVLCFANGGENFDSTSHNKYVLDSAEKYAIFKKHVQSLLRDDIRTGVPSSELVRVRVVLYAAGTAGTDDWNVYTYTLAKEDFRQMERNLVLGLLELGTYTPAEMVLVAAGKRPEPRVDRKWKAKKDGEVKVKKDKPSRGRRLW